MGEASTQVSFTSHTVAQKPWVGGLVGLANPTSTGPICQVGKLAHQRGRVAGRTLDAENLSLAPFPVLTFSGPVFFGAKRSGLPPGTRERQQCGELQPWGILGQSPPFYRSVTEAWDLHGLGETQSTAGTAPINHRMPCPSALPTG